VQRPGSSPDRAFAWRRLTRSIISAKSGKQANDLRSGNAHRQFSALTPGPGGDYDGTYNEEYVYVGGEGRLDPLQWRTVGPVKYVYFVTR